MVEIISSLMAMENDSLFPIMNCENLDADCSINAVTQAGTSPGDSFVNLNITPQGQASSVVVKKFV